MEATKKYFHEVWPEEEAILKQGLEWSRQSKAERIKKKVMRRIGFACKYMHEDQTQKKKLLEEIQRPLNTRSTTVAWLNRQTKEVAEERVEKMMEGKPPQLFDTAGVLSDYATNNLKDRSLQSSDQSETQS